MRALISFVYSLIVIALLICIVGWIFATDFFIFDILLLLGVFALRIVFWISIVIAILWILNEIFR
jgi:hypothetical protein